MNRLTALASSLICSLALACGGAETSPTASSATPAPAAAPSPVATETTIEPVDDVCGVALACLGGREREGLASVIRTPADLASVGCTAPASCTFPADTIYVVASTPGGGGCSRETAWTVAPTTGSGARTATLTVTDVGTCEMAFVSSPAFAALHGVPAGADVTVSVRSASAPD